LILAILFRPFGFIAPKTLIIWLSNLSILSVPNEGYYVPDEGYYVPYEGYYVPDEGYYVPDDGYYVPDDGYSKNASRALILISTFLFQRMTCSIFYWLTGFFLKS
jgi:hypothetical protein